MARRPQGRPLYRSGEIPEHLATVTMLRRMRRRLDPGQQPVASLIYYGNCYTELYEIAASVELPPRSPGRQAAYIAARTCARCGAVRDTPWPTAPVPCTTGRRLCAECAEGEAESSWWEWRHQARAAAVAWAQEVSTDPATVLFHADETALLTVDVYAVDLATGEVLIDARIRHDERDYQETPTWRPDSWDDTTVSIRDVADQVRALAGRRLIDWYAYYKGPRPLVWNMKTLLGEDVPLAIARRPYTWEPGVTGDDMGNWYSDWLSVRARDGSWRYDRWITHHDLPAGAQVPADVVAHMRQLLHLMAVDDHPAGPPTCPALLDGGRQVCGTPGPLIEGMCRACLTATVASPAGGAR